MNRQIMLIKNTNKFVNLPTDTILPTPFAVPLGLATGGKGVQSYVGLLENLVQNHFQYNYLHNLNDRNIYTK